MNENTSQDKKNRINSNRADSDNDRQNISSSRNSNERRTGESLNYPGNSSNLNERKEYLERLRAQRLSGQHLNRERVSTERPVREEEASRAVNSVRTEEPTRSEKPVRTEKSTRPERPERLQRTPSSERMRRTEETRRPEQFRKSGSSEFIEKFEGVETIGKPEKPEKSRIRTSGSNEMKIRSARNKKKRQMRAKGVLIGVVVLAILLSICAFANVLYQQKYGLSDEEMNATKYYDISREMDLVLILDTEIIGVGGMVEDGVPYISYETVTQYLNSRFYWDTNDNVLMYTLEDGTVEAKLGENEYSKGSETTQTEYPIVIIEGTDVYIAAEYVQVYTNIDYEFYSDPYRIAITSEWGEIETITVKKDTQVRYQAGVKSPILSYVEEGDVLTYLVEEEEIEDWTKVCTADGYIGYVQTKNLGEVTTETISREFEEQVYTNISVNYTINMAWHQVTSSAANDTILTTIADTEGLTTIAPTWFFINSTDGDVTSYASSTYVNYAHQLGIDVWAVLNDFDGEMNSQAETYEALSNSDTREKIINTVIAEAIQAGIDGINVDIENVSTECGEHYIQFIRELSVKCRQNGLVLSVDNYPPKAYNMHFDYEEQGIVADYVVIMGYDEHYGGSLESGSVSSISYVEEGVTEMLTMVSADKIISAIPFYTRLWTSTPKTDEELAEQAGTEEGEYLYNVSSQAYGMSSAQALVDEAGVEAEWDETTMQYYATWTVDDTIYEIWLEDDESIEAKLQVMDEYNLAGTAAWKLGFEDASIWSLIEKYVK